MRRLLCIILLAAAAASIARAEEDMTTGWTKGLDSDGHRPDTQWFQDAKFGIFIHWGLYSALGNEWKGKGYYGSGEWLMNRAKIPAAEYAKTADSFNPTGFDAEAWARFIKAAGARYLVITAKHHEGFAMFDSKASPFNIVQASPYGRDPMAALSAACRAEGIKFGFYYSQFLDWHEPNGGGNTWDFPAKRDVKRYYAEKSVPQIKELLSNYGPLGLVWFDMPGGLSRDETQAFMQEVRALQPSCLISSRVGNGFGDFRDFGDSELPPRFIPGPWEALFTHNDSWGFVRSDRNFKTPQEIIRLLAATSARGGNLLLNVGPDGTGRIPEYSIKYLTEVGRWLSVNGDSIYGTTHSPLADQPWGVSTLKPARLFLHVFARPDDGALLVPNFTAKAKRVSLLVSGAVLPWRQEGTDLTVTLPVELADRRDTVALVEFEGALAEAWSAPLIVSRQFDRFPLDAALGNLTGKAALKSITHSRYFGNWKHDTCVVGQEQPSDTAEFPVRVTAPGDYRVILEYACPAASKGREGVVEIAGQSLGFETVLTGGTDPWQPILFIRHEVGVVSISSAGVVSLVVHPKSAGVELFHLRRVVLEPVR